MRRGSCRHWVHPSEPHLVLTGFQKSQGRTTIHSVLSCSDMLGRVTGVNLSAAQAAAAERAGIATPGAA